MARRISDEEIRLSIVINGNEAQSQINNLERETIQYRQELQALERQQRVLTRQRRTDSDEYRENTRRIAELNRTISTNRTELERLTSELRLTDMTMAQLRNRATLLQATLRHLAPDTDQFREYQAELTQINNRMGELSGRSVQAESAIGNLADRFNRYAGLAASVVAVGTGVALSISQILDANGKLSDSMANVQKTTGMTKTEVEDLTKKFSELNTRTSRIDLLGIATVGGQIGIAKEEIFDFVKVMDKASVALGDSFQGGAEEVATKLGKIKGLYKEIKDVGVETAFEAVGSALNELGAAGTATEQNVSEFVTRLGSMPEQLKPTIQQALGLGAAFEESGLKAEVSATNYSKVISIAARDTDKFAKVMGMNTKEVEKLINTNPNEFFLKFADSIKNLSGTDLAKVLDGLKLNDNEVKQVIGAAGKNVDLFREKIKLAGEAMNESSSLTNEFNIKNQTLGATLEKLKKSIIGAFSSQTIVNFLGTAVNWFARFVDANEEADTGMYRFKQTLVFTAKVIAVITAAIITNVGWQKLLAMWTNRNTEATLLYNIANKTRAFIEGANIVVTQAGAAVMMLLRGNVLGAAQAFRVMTATMMTTPWGFILGAVAAIGAAYIVFADSTEKATAAQKVLAEVESRANEKIVEQKNELEQLVKVAKDETLSKEQRLKAINKLNEIIPDYIGNLTLENIKTMEGTEILKKYTAELYKNARAKAAKDRFDELAKEKLKVEEKKSGDFRKDSTFGFLADKSYDSAKNRQELEAMIRKEYPRSSTEFSKKDYEIWIKKMVEANDEYISDKEKEIENITAQQKALEPLLLENTIKELDNKGGGGANPNALGDGKGVKTNKAKEKYDDSYLKDAADRDEALYQMYIKSEEKRIGLMADGYDKELELQKLAYKKTIHEAQQKNNQLQTIQGLLEKDLTEAVKKGDTKKATSLREQLDDINQEIIYNNKIIVAEAAENQKRIALIENKGAKELLDQQKENYDRAKVERQIAHQNELNALGDNETEKEKLKKKFDADELKYEQDHLFQMIETLKKIINKDKNLGIDLSLLTPEQVAEFEKLSDQVKLKLAELMNAKEGKAKKEGPTNGEKLGVSKAPTDILGFTPENWDTFFQNLESGKFGIEQITFAVSALTEMYSKYAEFLTQSENAQLKKNTDAANKKKNNLKKQLDAGYINQLQYNRQVEKIDKDLENQKLEADIKQAKRQKLIAAMQIVTNTAQAIMGIWAQVPKFDFGVTAGILTGIVGALGALQLATVLAQPLPTRGAEKGLYPDYIDVQRSQDNKIFKKTKVAPLRSGLYNQETLLVGEGKKLEMVIDNKAYSQLSDQTKNALNSELYSIKTKGFEQGYYPNNVTTTAQPQTADNALYGLIQMCTIALDNNTRAIQDLQNKGVVGKFFKNDLVSAKNIKESLSDYDTLRNNNKY